METVKLNAKKREGEMKAKDLRKTGFVTAEYYGAGVENISLQMDYQDFRRAYRDAGKSTVVELAVDGADAVYALVHEVDYDPVTDKYIHVDFLHVDLNKEITTKVPFEFLGEAPAVRELQGTLMTALDGVEVKCVDADRNPVSAGDPGEILVRGYNVTSGYFNNPEATKEAIDEEGWLHTGDIGILDERGYIKITDRSKDMFIVGGFNAYPAEIENILCDHPAISQAAVIGIADDRMGEVAKAFIVLKPSQNLDVDTLMKWCKDNMANYKVPREIEFTQDLPTNAAGKVMKYVLKDES